MLFTTCQSVLQLFLRYQLLFYFLVDVRSFLSLMFNLLWRRRKTGRRRNEESSSPSNSFIYNCFEMLSNKELGNRQ